MTHAGFRSCSLCGGDSAIGNTFCTSCGIDLTLAIGEVLVQAFVSMGHPTSESASMAHDIFQQALGDIQGLEDMPLDFGEDLLRRESTDPVVKKGFVLKRQEGLTDPDVRWWWNRPPIERAIMDRIDGLHRQSHFMGSLAAGRTPEQAAAEVRKYHPFYGDPLDTRHTQGDDRPLPFELKDRIDQYIELRFHQERETYAQDIQNSTTFNALIRREIRSGKV